jgi:hypothetical protein
MTEKFKSMQIHPMRGHSRGEWYCSLDDVAPNAYEAEYWAIFGTTYRGITHCLGEFPTKFGAEAAAFGLRRSRSGRSEQMPSARQTVPSSGRREQKPAHADVRSYFRVADREIHFTGWPEERQPRASHGQAYSGQRLKEFSHDLAIPDSFNLPARFVIRVETKSRDQARLDVAIGLDDQLQIIQTSTPFEHEIVGKQFTALFCLKESDVEISAELWSDVYGEFMQIASGSGGISHKFVFSPHGPEYVFSGTAL